MSVESMAIVLHHSRATKTTKLILLGIANHDGDGGAWPSVQTLATYAGVSDRTVQRCIAELVELGEISVEYQQGGPRNMSDGSRPNRYEVLVRCPQGCDGTKNHRRAPVPSHRGDTSVTPGVTPVSPPPVTPVSPEPSLRNRPMNRPVPTPVTSTKRPLRRQATEVDFWPGPDHSHRLFAKRQGLDVDTEEGRFREAMGASGERRSNWPSSFAAFLSAVADGTDLDAFPSLDEDFGSSGALSVPTL